MTGASKPIVAIVGQPNVGKSTLFNRLAETRPSIVSDIAGTTRDRVIADVEWGERLLTLIDTGGLDEFPETELWSSVRDQIQVAIEGADVVVMLTDVTAGVTAPDEDVARVLRLSGRQVVLAVNKADNELREADAAEFYRLGLGEPTPVSAYHNRGVDEMMSRVLDLLPDGESRPDPEADFRLAIVGRTNVGKSMLLNSILGEERAIVSDVPGTTRDALDTLVTVGGRTVHLIDTAGLRRRGRIERGIEQFSAIRTIRAIDRAEVAVLVMDASELATTQDSHIAGYVLEAYRGIVLAINKWDLAGGLEVTKEEAERKVRERFKFVSHVPICFTSALDGTGIGDLLEQAAEVHRKWSMGLPRYDLRRTVLNAVAAHPPATGRRRLKFYGVTQDNSQPPSFTFYVNNSDVVHFSYRRYLENALRSAYGFEGTPLRMRFKSRGER